MADLSQMSNEELMALKRQRLSSMSDEELLALRNKRQPQAQEAPKQEQEPRTGLREGAAQVITNKLFGFGDEVSGVLNGVGRLIGGRGDGPMLIRDETGQVRERDALDGDRSSPLGYGKAVFDDAVASGVKHWQDVNSAAEDFRRDRPKTAMAVGLAAGLTDVVPAAKAAGVADKTVRYGERVLRGTKAGAVAGGAAGFGYGTDMDSRTQGAAVGAGLGAGLGAAVPGVVEPILRKGGEAIRPAANSLYDAFRQGAQSGQVNSLFGALDNTGPAPAPRPKPTARQRVNRDLVKMVDDAGGGDAIRESTAIYREAGKDPLTAIALENPGLRALRVAAKSPGKTGSAADAVIAQNRLAQPVDIQSTIDEVFPAVVRRDAQGQINNMFDEASAQYRKVLAGANVEDAAMGKLAPILDRMPQEVQDLAEGTLARLAKYDGLDPNALNTAQRLHYMKRAMGQIITGMKRQGLQADEARSLTRLQTEYVKALDDVIPGYGDVRGKWAELSDAEEALSWSKGFFDRKVPSGDLKAEFADMSDAQKQHALIGIAEDLKQQVKANTKTGVRKTNIAASILTEDKIEKIKAVLGPENARKLEVALRIADNDFEKLSKVLGGSDTFADSVHFADQHAKAIATDAATGKLSGMADKGAGWGVNSLWNALMEGHRNKLGAELLKPMTRSREDELIAAWAELQKQRGLSTNNAVTGATFGGRQVGSAAGQQ